MRHVLVLAPILGLNALVPALLPLEDGMVREDLKGTENHVAPRAIDDKHLLSDVRRQVGAHPVGEQDSVWIDLQGEGVAPPHACGHHRLPCVHEKLRVPCGVVDGDANRCALEPHGLGGADSGRATSGQDRVVVACEDANALRGLSPEQADLVASQAQHGEAVQGREPPTRDAVTPRPERLARPSVVVVVGVGPGHATALALGPVRILLIALHVHTQATPRVLAALLDARALRERPVRKRSDGF
mmetsp:Transcript_83621/g.241944  ORF Transcript_83621/g.241944 Transcript_83621/m.241944 type:complete len:244 (+) Transcript_83621:447-1178(+)